MELTVAGIDRLRAFSREQYGSANPALLLEELRGALEDAARAEAPERSGRLRDSITVDTTPTGLILEADEQIAPYAALVITGTAAGWMTGLIGHVVAFEGRGGETVVRRVRFVGVGRDGRSHWWTPGTPPNDFMLRALHAPAVADAIANLRALGLPVAIVYAGRPIV